MPLKHSSNCSAAKGQLGFCCDVFLLLFSLDSGVLVFFLQSLLFIKCTHGTDRDIL